MSKVRYLLNMCNPNINLLDLHPHRNKQIIGDKLKVENFMNSASKKGKLIFRLILLIHIRNPRFLHHKTSM